MLPILKHLPHLEVCEWPQCRCVLLRAAYSSEVPLSRARKGDSRIFGLPCQGDGWLIGEAPWRVEGWKLRPPSEQSLPGRLVLSRSPWECLLSGRLPSSGIALGGLVGRVSLD